VADVVAAVNFARENNLRLVIKGGGHSYQGASCAPDSLLIWTRHMDWIVLHDAFVPQGCAGQMAPQPAVQIGAGAIWLHVYQEVTGKGGRFVRGGGCTTVGVAGLVQSGGFGNFPKKFGTAAGSLLEAEIVTADGQVRVVNACRDPDLFWAVKGGGGGTFGVVTKLVMKTYELPEALADAQLTVKAASDEAFRRLIGQFVAFYRDRLFNPHWDGSFHVRHDNTLAVSMLSQGLDALPAGRVWRPFLDWIAASPRIITCRCRRRSTAWRRATGGTRTSVERMRQARSLPTTVPGRRREIFGGPTTAWKMAPCGMGISPLAHCSVA
jgi:FAD/FMN-containing dehydrogenase